MKFGQTVLNRRRQCFISKYGPGPVCCNLTSLCFPLPPSFSNPTPFRYCLNETKRWNWCCCIKHLEWTFLFQLAFYLFSNTFFFQILLVSQMWLFRFWLMMVYVLSDRSNLCCFSVGHWGICAGFSLCLCIRYRFPCTIVHLDIGRWCSCFA